MKVLNLISGLLLGSAICASAGTPVAPMSLFPATGSYSLQKVASDKPTAKVNFYYNKAYDTNFVNVYTYNIGGDKILDYQASPGPKGLQVDYRDSYDYDTSHRVRKHFAEYLDKSKWYGYSKDTMAYDSMGNLVLGIVWEWKTSYWQIVNSLRNTYTYSNKGVITQNISAVYDTISGKFVNTYKLMTTLDGAGNITSTQTDMWDAKTSKWVNFQILTGAKFYHNDPAKILKGILQEYNGKKYVNKSNIFATINGDGMLDSQYVQTYDTTSSKWVPYYYEKQVWDTLANVHRQSFGVLISWDPKAKIWEIYAGTRHKFTYDGSKRLVEDITEQYSSSTITWNIRGKDVYLFTPFTQMNNNNSPKFGPLAIYPNPATDNLNLKLPAGSGAGTVRIMDVTGKTVLTQQISPNSTSVNLQVADLKSGIYIVNVISEGNSYIQRFVKN